MIEQLKTIRDFIESAYTTNWPRVEDRNAAHDAIEQLEAMVGEKEPGFSQPVFKEVATGIEVGYDLFGGVDIRLGGEFVYVHINYDHRYTHNAARARLADQIVGLLTGAAPVAQQPQAETLPVHQCTGSGNIALGKAGCPFCREEPQAETAPANQ